MHHLSSANKIWWVEIWLQHMQQCHTRAKWSKSTNYSAANNESIRQLKTTIVPIHSRLPDLQIPYQKELWPSVTQCLRRSITLEIITSQPSNFSEKIPSFRLSSTWWQDRTNVCVRLSNGCSKTNKWRKIYSNRSKMRIKLTMQKSLSIWNMPSFTKKSRISIIKYTSKRKKSSVKTLNQTFLSLRLRKTNLLVLQVLLVNLKLSQK